MFDRYYLEGKPFKILDSFEGMVWSSGTPDAHRAIFALISEKSHHNEDRDMYSIVAFRATEGIGGRIVVEDDKMWRTAVFFLYDEDSAINMFNEVSSNNSEPIMTYRDWDVRVAH